MKKIVGAALAPCVHVAGLDHFLRLCEKHGWNAIALGPAIPVQNVLAAMDAELPDWVALSYRLTPEDLEPIIEDLRRGLNRIVGPRPKFVFGGTPATAAVAKASGLFDKVFDGTESMREMQAFTAGKAARRRQRDFPQDLATRIESSYPFPLIRHHYGEPDVERTIRGARRIARAEALDILSIGPDQNAQEHFFHPERMDPGQHGAGGVPVRTTGDLAAIYKATRRGNYPLLRCYSGTRDLMSWGRMSIETIHNAWAAIPLCWYSVMDGRSRVPLPEAIAEKQAAMRFHAEQDIPVEVNESHQWSLRESHDALAVAMAFLAAYNAKAQGVKRYVIQMMHNTPPSTSPAMDLAKMLAKLELIREIEGPEFTTWREVRAGIASLPPDFDEAKGHMAASAVYAMALNPHILHVVGFSEAYRVVDPKILVESCRIARGAVRLALLGAPNPLHDPAVVTRKAHLVSQARILLDGIHKLGPDRADPWSDPDVLARAIATGVLDAPHFRGNPHLCGRIVTACINGGWEAVEPATCRIIGEEERLQSLRRTV